MGIIAYLVVVKLIFNPDIVNVPIVAFKIFQNIGTPTLKSRF